MNNLSSQNVNGPTAVNNTVGLATNPNNSNTSRILPTEMPGSTQTSLSGVLHPGKLPSTQVGSSTSPMGISNSSTATFLQNWNLLPSHVRPISFLPTYFLQFYVMLNVNPCFRFSNNSCNSTNVH
jgi:hypothetical protein